jgi:hypothetical protein
VPLRVVVHRNVWASFSSTSQLSIRGTGRKPIHLRPKCSSIRSIMVFAAPISAERIARDASNVDDGAECHVDEIVVGRMPVPCAPRSTALRSDGRHKLRDHIAGGSPGVRVAKYSFTARLELARSRSARPVLTRDADGTGCWSNHRLLGLPSSTAQCGLAELKFSILVSAPPAFIPARSVAPDRSTDASRSGPYLLGADRVAGCRRSRAAV